MTTVNPILKSSIVMLERKARREKVGIWRAASEMLARTSSRRVEVNLTRLARLSSDASAIFVPGKVLGSGTFARKLVIGAYSFSASARRKIEGSGGRALSVQEFLEKYPKGRGVLLVE